MTKRLQKDQILEFHAANPDARNVEIAKALGVSQAYVSTVLQRAGIAPKCDQPPRCSDTRSSVKRDAILAMAQADRTLKRKEIAERVGSSAAYVCQVLNETGLSRVPVASKSNRKTAKVSETNAEWARNQAVKNNVSFCEFVDACLTDARLDDEERTGE